MSGRETPRLLGLVALVLLVAALPASSAANPAPSFRLFDVDGVPLSSTGLLGRVVVLDFDGTWCTPCKQIEKSFADSLVPRFAGNVTFISVFIPGEVQNRTVLANYRATHPTVTWHMATDNDTVSSRYNVFELPHIFVIDRNGYIAVDYVPTIPVIASTVTQELGASIERVLGGTVAPVNFVGLSIPALLVVAALLSFFSPCSFPVLPAFMAFYLKLDSKGESDPASKPTTRTAAGRGFIASLGLVTVYGIIALVVFAAGFAAQSVLPFVSPVVGVVLILFGILTLLPFQYYFLTRPFVALKKRVAARFGGNWTPGIRTKLFAFGVGYGAAGFACVAPPFIGAVLNASAIGRPQDALFGLALYVVIVIVTMILVVVGLHVAGERLLKKIRVWSAAIKYVSATALLIAGGYLLWLFGSAYL